MLLRSLVVLVSTYGRNTGGVCTVYIVTGTGMGVEFGHGKSLDGIGTGISPALAVSGMVGGQLEGQLAATLVVEVGPGGVAGERRQVRAVADTVDIGSSLSGFTGYEVSLGTEQQAVGKADDGPVDAGGGPGTIGVHRIPHRRWTRTCRVHRRTGTRRHIPGSKP